MNTDLLELLQRLLESFRVVAVNPHDVPDGRGLWVLDGDGEDAVVVGAIVLLHEVLVHQPVP